MKGGLCLPPMFFGGQLPQAPCPWSSAEDLTPQRQALARAVSPSAGAWARGRAATLRFHTGWPRHTASPVRSQHGAAGPLAVMFHLILTELLLDLVVCGNRCVRTKSKIQAQTPGKFWRAGCGGGEGPANALVARGLGPSPCWP